MDRYSLKKDILQQRPIVHSSTFVAPGARVLFDVRLKEYVSVWYNAVLRGDVNFIEIGVCSNIQDGSIVHVDNDHPCQVMDFVTVGHHVNLHGCVVEENCLIGIGAIILSGVKIGRGSIVAAGAVVKENTQVPPHSLVAGTPAKKIKDLTIEHEENNRKISKKYVELAKKYILNQKEI